MKLTGKTLLLVLVCVCSVMVSVGLTSFIAERFFFDRLLYIRSNLYGYQVNGQNPLDYPNGRLIEKRTEDLRLLTQIDADKNTKVLGLSLEDDYK